MCSGAKGVCRAYRQNARGSNGIAARTKNELDDEASGANELKVRRRLCGPRRGTNGERHINRKRRGRAEVHGSTSRIFGEVGLSASADGGPSVGLSHATEAVGAVILTLTQTIGRSITLASFVAAARGGGYGDRKTHATMAACECTSGHLHEQCDEEEKIGKCARH